MQVLYEILQLTWDIKCWFTNDKEAIDLHTYIATWRWIMSRIQKFYSFKYLLDGELLSSLIFSLSVPIYACNECISPQLCSGEFIKVFNKTYGHCSCFQVTLLGRRPKLSVQNDTNNDCDAECTVGWRSAGDEHQMGWRFHPRVFSDWPSVVPATRFLFINTWARVASPWRRPCAGTRRQQGRLSATRQVRDVRRRAEPRRATGPPTLRTICCREPRGRGQGDRGRHKAGASSWCHEDTVYHREHQPWFNGVHERQASTEGENISRKSKWLVDDTRLRQTCEISPMAGMDPR